MLACRASSTAASSAPTLPRSSAQKAAASRAGGAPDRRASRAPGAGPDSRSTAESNWAWRGGGAAQGGHEINRVKAKEEMLRKGRRGCRAGGSGVKDETRHTVAHAACSRPPSTLHNKHHRRPTNNKHHRRPTCASARFSQRSRSARAASTSAARLGYRSASAIASESSSTLMPPLQRGKGGLVRHEEKGSEHAGSGARAGLKPKLCEQRPIFKKAHSSGREWSLHGAAKGARPARLAITVAGQRGRLLGAGLPKVFPVDTEFESHSKLHLQLSAWQGQDSSRTNCIFQGAQQRPTCAAAAAPAAGRRR
jgi:hypothetical protein